MKTKEKILGDIKKNLLQHNSIIFVYVFGSFIEINDYNDIDIAVYSNSDNFDSLKLSCELERQLRINFDVIDLKNAPDYLIYEISKGKVLIDIDENFRIDFISAAWSRYQDIKYYRNRFLEELNYD